MDGFFISRSAPRAADDALFRVGSPTAAELQCACPLFGHTVRAGFPSPADDYIEERISLDEHLIRNQEATFFLRVAGDSMVGAGIRDGDLLVVDRSITPAPGHVVIAVLDGQLTVKQLVRTARGYALRAAHPDYPDILMGQDQELLIWGVVRWAIHKVAP